MSIPELTLVWQPNAVSFSSARASGPRRVHSSSLNNCSTSGIVVNAPTATSVQPIARLCSAVSFEGGICSCLVFHHPRQQAFAKAAAQNNSVVAPKRIVAQRHQGPLCCRWIAYRQRAHKPGTARIRNCTWIGGEKQIDRFEHRSRLAFPVKVNLSTGGSGRNIVWNNRQCAIQCGSLLWIASQNLVADGNLLERRKIARIKFHCPLQVTQSFFLLAAPAQNEAGQFKDARIIR